MSGTSVGEGGVAILKRDGPIPKGSLPLLGELNGVEEFDVPVKIQDLVLNLLEKGGKTHSVDTGLVGPVPLFQDRLFETVGDVLDNVSGINGAMAHIFFTGVRVFDEDGRSDLSCREDWTVLEFRLFDGCGCGGRGGCGRHGG